MCEYLAIVNIDKHVRFSVYDWDDTTLSTHNVELPWTHLVVNGPVFLFLLFNLIFGILMTTQKSCDQHGSIIFLDFWDELLHILTTYVVAL